MGEGTLHGVGQLKLVIFQNSSFPKSATGAILRSFPNQDDLLNGAGAGGVEPGHAHMEVIGRYELTE